ncbi:hypothetical protein BFS14_14960 [Serratia fonticola]|nr:hypothetical protein BFS14_14960 [Serratia fonticola]
MQIPITCAVIARQMQSLRLSGVLSLVLAGWLPGQAEAATVSYPVEGRVTQTTCDLTVVTDKGTGSSLTMNFENISLSTLKQGTILGIQKLEMKLEHCKGAVSDQNFNKLVAINVSGNSTINYLFRSPGMGPGVPENNADAGIGFVIIAKDPGGNSMQWNAVNLVQNNDPVDTKLGTAGAFHNNFNDASPPSVNLWIGISCGSPTDCSAVNQTGSGSLSADLSLELAYK